MMERQVDKDITREQKKSLEDTKKPFSMKSKGWLNWIKVKVIDNYVPRIAILFYPGVFIGTIHFLCE